MRWNLDPSHHVAPSRGIALLSVVFSCVLASCGFADGGTHDAAPKEETGRGSQAGLQQSSEQVQAAPAPDVTIGAPALQAGSDPQTPEPPAATAPREAVPKLIGTASRPLYVLLTGDSMTRGDEHTPGGARSFRGRLYHMLTAAGLTVDFLGSQNERPAVGGDPNHDAWGGAWIGPGGSDLNIYDRMPTVLAANVNPDIIVLALGWNSAVYEKPIAADKYEALVNRVAALKPGAQLVLGTLSPYRGETEEQTASHERGYREINQRAREMAGRSTSDQLHLTDLAIGKFNPSDYIDPVHWNQSGADKAAQIVFDTILNRVMPVLP